VCIILFPVTIYISISISISVFHSVPVTILFYFQWPFLFRLLLWFSWGDTVGPYSDKRWPIFLFKLQVVKSMTITEGVICHIFFLISSDIFAILYIYYKYRNLSSTSLTAFRFHGSCTLWIFSRPVCEQHRHDLSIIILFMMLMFVIISIACFRCGEQGTGHHHVSTLLCISRSVTPVEYDYLVLFHVKWGWHDPTLHNFISVLSICSLPLPWFCTLWFSVDQ